MKTLIALAALLFAAHVAAQGTSTGSGFVAGSSAGSAAAIRLQMVGPGTINPITVTAKNESTATAAGAVTPTPTGTTTAVSTTTINTPVITLPVGARGAVVAAGVGSAFAAVGGITLSSSTGPAPILPPILPLPPILVVTPL